MIAATVGDADGHECVLTFVALTHPAQQWPNVKRRCFDGLESYEAEEELLRAGVRKIQE